MILNKRLRIYCCNDQNSQNQSRKLTKLNKNDNLSHI